MIIDAVNMKVDQKCKSIAGDPNQGQGFGKHFPYSVFWYSQNVT